MHVTSAEIKSAMNAVKGLARKRAQWLADREELESVGNMAVAKSIETFDRVKPYNFVLWACMRARRDMGNYLRSQAHRGRDTRLLDDPRIDSRHESNVDDADLTAYLRAWLSPRQSEAIHYVYDRGMNWAEASKEMGCHESCLPFLHKRAMEIMRWRAQSQEDRC